MTCPIEAGDVVVCIDNFPDENTPPHLFQALNRVVIGGMYRVTQTVSTAGGLGLLLASTPSPRKSGWAARRFKKLRKADPEFAAQLFQVAV